MEAIGRVRRWTRVLLLLLLVCCWAVDPGYAISYKVEPSPGRVGQESGLTFSTSVNRDQFVFSDAAASFAPQKPASDDRKGRVRFLDTPDTHPQSPTNYYNVNRGQGDSFYTVGATIQMAGSADTITPPPVEPTYVKPPKRRKLKVQPTYDRRQQLDYDQQSYSPLQDNYLQPSGQRQQYNQQYQQQQQYGQAAYAYPGVQQNQPTYYPGGAQQSQPGYDTNSLYPANYQSNSPYYPYPQQYPPNPYLQSHPQQHQQLYQNPFYQQQQHQQQQQSNAPNAQSILGFLQSIFNFAPGTFGTPAAYPQSGSGSGFGSGFGPIGGQLRQALDNISENDELQCVPKLVCMMSRGSSGIGFSNYVNRGLLSTILSAVPDSSPWLKFSRAALLGYGIGANSCDAYYPKCPKDEMQILYYLNNHRGGFFRFFNNDPGTQYGRPVGGGQQG